MSKKRFEMSQLTNTIEDTALVNTPQFPAAQRNFSVEQIRSLIKKQKRAKGYMFPCQANLVQDFNLDISGSARIFLGFSLLFDTRLTPPEFSLKINNEILIQQVNPQFFTNLFQTDEFYFFPRPLSGSDSVVSTIRSLAAVDVNMIVYYI